jgi:hypothetical protein
MGSTEHVRAVCANPRVRLGGEERKERKKEKRKEKEEGKKKKRIWKFASSGFFSTVFVPFVKSELKNHFRPLSLSPFGVLFLLHYYYYLVVLSLSLLEFLFLIFIIIWLFGWLRHLVVGLPEQHGGQILFAWSSYSPALAPRQLQARSR